MLLYNKQKKNAKGNRILISITVLGSAGPIRFLAYDEDLVASVIDTALKCYAREGRLPLLGSDFNDFLLYCPMVGPEALSAWKGIGLVGARNFTLCRKPEEKKMVKEGVGARKGGSFKAWINKSFSLRVSTH
ncbi:unnamed protein product [Eruca vesicaria subsp. sativa]|uniref:DUF7054 domain-containing protein n=1 Tax=Eruca vesicaria subsp. sativa TaxID=29727 RepID=A0ABC8JR10_ERUVS|nr:unnamed protein product [Eruca vesicaria subsp. sativa]